MLIKVNYKLITEKPFKYQWLRDGQPIEGARKFAYKVTQADVGCTLERVADYMVDIYREEPDDEN